MNFDELKQLVDDRIGYLDQRQEKYKKWAEILIKLKITGFTVVIVYDTSVIEDDNGFPKEIDHALIWKSSNEKSANNEHLSRFYVATIEKDNEEMKKIFVYPIGAAKLDMKEAFFSKINDDEVEKIIKNCMKINPLGFHYINTVSNTVTNEGTASYIDRAIERYYEFMKIKSLKG